MHTLAAVAVRRPVFTWVLSFAVIALGVAAFRGLGLERYPDVNMPYVTVTTLSPGLSASQVEREVSQRLENALGSIAGLRRLDSTSQEGLSIVLAEFELSRPASAAAQDVRDRVARIVSELPPSARPPQVEAFNPNASPVVLLALRSSAGGPDLDTLSSLARKELRRGLQTVSGVGEVRLLGERRQQLRVSVSPEQLDAFDLTAAEVRDALLRENLDAPGGDVVAGRKTVMLRLDARARTTKELAAIAIAQRGQRVVRLGDVATLETTSAVPDSVASVSGEPALLLAVLKQSGANTVAVADAVQEAVVDLQARLPAGAVLEVVRDESLPVRASLHAVEEHLVLGAVFAAAVVLVFLRSWRATLIAALAIPTSVIGTFAAVKALGLTLNMMTLLGLTLAVGIVIDDAIVVLENIARVMGQRRGDGKTAALEATREIALAVLATTLSLVAVFLPVGLMTGVVGKFLAAFGLTMSVSILLSMGVAFTLTPMLCARWLREADVPKHHEAGTLERAYERVLRWALGRPGWVLAAAAVTVLSTVPLLVVVPKTFLPTEDEGRFEVFVRLPEGTSLDATRLEVRRLGAALRTLDGVERTVEMVGSPRGDASGRGPHEATLYVTLRGAGRQAETMQAARALLAGPAERLGATVFVGAVNDLGSAGPDGAPVQYVLSGPDLDVLDAFAQRLLDEARRLEGTSDHSTSRPRPATQLAVRVDRALAQEAQVSHAAIGDALVLASREGLPLGSVDDAAGQALEVRFGVELPLESPEATVRRLTVRSATGERLTLGSLASLSMEPGPAQIRRVGRSRQVTVSMNVAPGVSEAGVVEALDEASARLGLPPGVRVEVLGNAKELERSLAAFLEAIVLSLLFMYLVLAAQFESWLHPLVILASLPLTVPFAMLSLLVFGQTVNVLSLLGVLVLFGIVKKNAILQVDHALSLERAGLPRREALVRGSLERLRPILMTTLAFVAGLVPLVVSSGPGAGTNRAIAVGVMGGQTLSLLLTLVATPVLHELVERLREAWAKRRAVWLEAR
jgi:HAE1 family hydrophobic/amphiphilic exporter-1